MKIKPLYILGLAAVLLFVWKSASAKPAAGTSTVVNGIEIPGGGW